MNIVIGVVATAKRLAVVVLLLLGGCRTSGSAHVSPPTRFDRLVQLYPELRSGRFVILADFEEPKHMELFRLKSTSKEARCVYDSDGGRPESGPGALLFTSVSPDDTVVISNEGATQWYLKRDWRDYDLLLMSIRAPVRHLGVELTIASGPPEDRLAAHASLRLHKGWNVLRLDLASIGEHLSLDDIQEIRLAVSGAEGLVELAVDDILLTADRMDISGDSGDRNAGLYVQQVGRRWKIGAGKPGSDFELTFANGQIVGWFNVGADPYRLRNLLQNRPLGPTPVLLGSSESAPLTFDRLGDRIVVRPRLVETNAVRAVVSSEWRFVPDSPSAEGGLDGRPFHKWVYTIYRSGQLYVAVETTTETEGWSASDIGLTVPLPSWREETPQAFVSGLGGDGRAALPSSANPIPAYGAARLDVSDAGLLYVLHDPAGAARVFPSSQHNSGDVSGASTESWVATRPRRPGAVEHWACHILFGTAEEVSETEALARAIDYNTPAAIRLEVGSWAPSGSAPPGLGGYVPDSGCHRIAPAGGSVRLVLNGAVRPHYSPVFQILDPDQRDAWVYVDHLSFEPVARDAEGNLIFQLPGVVRKRTLVEVIFRRQPAGRPAGPDVRP